MYCTLTALLAVMETVHDTNSADPVRFGLTIERCPLSSCRHRLDPGTGMWLQATGVALYSRVHMWLQDAGVALNCGRVRTIASAMETSSLLRT